MAGAWITVNGVWQPVTNSWLTASGVWEPAAATWTTEAGVWQPTGLAEQVGATVNLFTAYPTSIWNQVNVQWDVENADRVEVYANDTVIYSGPLNIHQVTLSRPAGSVTFFKLVTVSADTSAKFGPEPIVQVGSPPIPANLRVTATSPLSITYAWDTVPSGTRYDLRLTNGTALYSGSNSAYAVSVDPETTIQAQVRSVSGTSPSEWSSAVSGTSDSATWKQGSYTVDPVNGYTWMAGKSSWRAASAGLFHGNYRDGRGAQFASFFYESRFKDKFKADLDAGAEVVKVEIALRRVSGTGAPGRQQARVQLHTRGQKPSGAITNFTSFRTDVTPLLRRNPDGLTWHELPTHWGRRLIRQEDGVKGLVVGMYDDERYFEMPPVSNSNRIGRVRITLR